MQIFSFHVNINCIKTRRDRNKLNSVCRHIYELDNIIQTTTKYIHFTGLCYST